MILVKCKKESDFYWGSSIGLVIAKIINKKEKYIVYSDKSTLSMPYPYELSSLIFIENTIPNDWIYTKDIDGSIIRSFKEWTEDEYFYEKISDSSNKEHEKSKSILQSKINKYINDYAIKNFGSTEEAKKMIAIKKYSKTVSEYKNNGYETIGLIDPNINYSEDNNPINLSDLEYVLE